MLDTEMITANAKRNSNARHQDRLVITASVVILAAAVMLCAALIVPPLWTVLVEAWDRDPRTQECNTLADVDARRACYDSLDERMDWHPPKGTDLPLVRRNWR
jgi:hypothetical protein